MSSNSSLEVPINGSENAFPCRTRYDMYRAQIELKPAHRRLNDLVERAKSIVAEVAVNYAVRNEVLKEKIEIGRSYGLLNERIDYVAILPSQDGVTVHQYCASWNKIPPHGGTIFGDVSKEIPFNSLKSGTIIETIIKGEII